MRAEVMDGFGTKWVYAEWFEDDQPVCVCVYPHGYFDDPEPDAHEIHGYWLWHVAGQFGPVIPGRFAGKP